MSRWRLLIGLGLGLVVMLLLGYLALWFAVPSEVRAYERIQLGMRRSEVEQVLGVPPGDYSNRSPHVAIVKYKRIETVGSEDDKTAPGRAMEFWKWDEHCIWVAFDDEGKSVGFSLAKVTDPKPPSLLDRIWKLLGN